MTSFHTKSRDEQMSNRLGVEDLPAGSKHLHFFYVSIQVVIFGMPRKAEVTMADFTLFRTSAEEIDLQTDASIDFSVGQVQKAG